METQSTSTGPQPKSGQNFLKQLEDFFNTYLHQKAPFHLPPNIKELIVKFGPWIALVIMIAAIPVILVALGLKTMILPLAMTYGVHFGPWFAIAGLIGLASLVFEAMALPGLFARSHKGWQLLYYSVLINAVAQLLRGEIFSLIVNVIISMYILFEIKEYYK